MESRVAWEEASPARWRRQKPFHNEFQRHLASGQERFATKFAKKRKSERKEMCGVRTYKTYSDIC